MPLIYEPRGAAREYSPLALNIYSTGCSHRCRYCYCPGVMRGKWTHTPTPRNLAGLEREAKRARRQVLLSFLGDPYVPEELTFRSTLAALEVLKAARCSVAVLTKGGRRCLRDLELFQAWPDGRLKVGATLTLYDEAKSREWEPGAALPEDRLAALEALHHAGVRTWASIEPVIEPDESLRMIERSLPFVDAYKVGKLNHQASATDWRAFLVAAVELVRGAGKALYVKDALRPYAAPGYLTADECDAETLCLPDRPGEAELSKPEEVASA